MDQEGIQFLQEWQSSHFPNGNDPALDATGIALHFINTMRDSGVPETDIRDALTVIGNFADSHADSPENKVEVINNALNLYANIRPMMKQDDSLRLAIMGESPDQYRGQAPAQSAPVAPEVGGPKGFSM